MTDIVIGVDPSTKAMHAVLTKDDSKPVMLVQQLNKVDKPMAAADTFTWMHHVVTEYNQIGCEVFVFIEIPVMGRAGAHAMLVIAQVVGAAAAAAHLAGAKVTLVNNQTWKKSSVGRGNCGKPEIRAWCKEAWPVAYALADGNQDLMDAAGINVHGRHVLGLRTKRVGPRKVIRRRKVSA
jgi:Holliday junction resolvasome RuvABC endonuclease subunit